MPVPATFDDISETPSSNSPQGSEPFGTQANEYLQTGFAFSKQLYDGKWKPSGAVTMNAQKLTALAAGSTTSTSTDAVTGAQLRAFAYKVGEIRIWNGFTSAIASIWGPGWQVSDGTNGTPDLRDRFIVGSGASYALNAQGGANTVALTTANMPSHNHAISDPGHSHGYADPGHSHGYSDPGHNHLLPNNVWTDNGGGSSVPFQGNIAMAHILQSTGNANIGIQINASSTGIQISSSSTGISTLNNGSGSAHENRPPYWALVYLCYTGLGA